MAWNFSSWLNNVIYTRDKSGNHWYERTPDGKWGIEGKTNLAIAQNHPILTPALLFRSKLFSQAEFKVVHKTSGKVMKDHWLIKLLYSPSRYQTQSDFLESLDFIQVAQGKSVCYLKRRIGYKDNKDIEAIYILNSDLIDWGDYSSEFLNRTQDSKIDNQTIIYDKDGENLEIKLGDLLFFYDLPNMLCQTGSSNSPNFFETKSRLDGLRQTLINTHDSLIAKNIILKTNGKEIISGATGSSAFPMDADDKKASEELLQNNYGLGWFRKRGIVTKSNINWQSAHIALRDLGLDESVKVDGNIIYTALHIPKDIISLEAKKTTYANFKESMVSYVQNEMQSSVDAFTDVMNTLIDDTNYKLVGSYEHLPIMQFIEQEKYDVIIKRATALRELLSTGVPKEYALELSGFERTMTLEDINPTTIENQNGNGNKGSTQESEEDEKWRKAIEERIERVEEEQE